MIPQTGLEKLHWSHTKEKGNRRDTSCKDPIAINDGGSNGMTRRGDDGDGDGDGGMNGGDDAMMGRR